MTRPNQVRTNAGAAKRGFGRHEHVSVAEASRTLNVSPTYVKQLVAAGRFQGFAKLANGHLRIPATEVVRVARAMKARRRRALNKLAELMPKAEQPVGGGRQERRWVPRLRPAE